MRDCECGVAVARCSAAVAVSGTAVVVTHAQYIERKDAAKTHKRRQVLDTV